MSCAVAFDQVGKRYGDITAVEQVDLAVAAGESLALLGHNGAGKTTLLKLMLGLIRPSSGRVRVLGVDPAGGDGARGRRETGFLPEHVAFDAAMSGLELLRFYARLKRSAGTQCLELLERVGLAEAARRRVRTYSKGMRQRLGLAQALLGAPRLLLLDEPTGGLDPASRQRFYEILRDLSARGSTVILSSHLLTELEQRTDRLVILDRGRVVASGTLDELRARARLPERFRVAVANGKAEEVSRQLAGAVDLALVNGSSLSFSCLPEAKMPIVRRLVELGPLVEDLNMVSPSLEDVYASFVGRELSP
jgi:Cu-processing system ATP-binding protein